MNRGLWHLSKAARAGAFPGCDSGETKQKIQYEQAERKKRKGYTRLRCAAPSHHSYVDDGAEGEQVPEIGARPESTSACRLYD
jgi:hypothetical protein